MTSRIRTKQRIKNAAYLGVGASNHLLGITWARGVLSQGDRALRVLMYHKVNDRPGNTLSVSPAMLQRQLDHVTTHYRVVTPEEVFSVATDVELPPGAVLITFDDGYEDNYTNAYPILRSMGLRALVFVATDFIGSKRVFPHDEHLEVSNPTLSWPQLSAMADAFMVGSHGRSHRVLTGLRHSEARDEIRDSKAIIEDKLGVEVSCFSYPKGSVGDFDARLEEVVRDSGYRTSFVTVPGANSIARVRSGQWIRRYNAEPLADYTFARLLDGSCDLVRVKDTPMGNKAKRLLNGVLGTATP
jgi:peptidoglycan/xylan/chitin deacetylase (PgdA/CDA1 family)